MIARHLHMDARAIQWYERWFYDVRGQATAYLRRWALPADPLAGDASQAEGQFWKVLAFHMGAKALLSLWNSTESLPDDIQRLLSDLARDNLLRLGWVAAMRLQVSQETAPKIVNLYLGLKKLELKAQKLEHRIEMARRTQPAVPDWTANMMALVEDLDRAIADPTGRSSLPIKQGQVGEEARRGAAVGVGQAVDAPHETVESGRSAPQKSPAGPRPGRPSGTQLEGSSDGDPSQPGPA